MNRLLSVPFLLLMTATTLRAADPKPVPVDPAKWKSVPCVQGRLATDADTKAGRAVFVLAGDPNTINPVAMALPRCAIWHDTDRREDVPVVCIQAESQKGNKIVGFRLVKGGFGMATVAEMTFLDAPDARFKP